MNEYSGLVEIVKTLGISGLVIYVAWKVIDKWAGRFLEVQIQQATSMGAQATATSGLAAAMREGQGQQQELMLAVRVMATKLDETMGLAREIKNNCLAARQEGVCPKT